MKSSKFDKFVLNAKSIHNNKYIYSSIDFINNLSPISITCPIHGVFVKTPFQHVKLKQGCSKCAESEFDLKCRSEIETCISDGLQPLDITEFINNAALVHGDKYDYSDSMNFGRDHRIAIRCPTHGEFYTTPRGHINRRQGCKKCRSSEDLSINNFESLFRNVHGNKYDYSKVEYVRNKHKIIIICPRHGEFQQTPSNHLMGQGCQKCALEFRNQNLVSRDFVNKVSIIHNGFYDYSKVEYIGNKSKVTIICPKHGEFEQIPNSHILGKGCTQCAIEASKDALRISFDEFLARSLNYHGPIYEYDKDSYIDMGRKINILCQKHGRFSQSAYHHTLGAGCPRCSSSIPQSQIASFVESLTSSSVLFNDRTAIKPVELDIFIPSVDLAIEHHGLYWHSYGSTETRNQKFKHYNKYVKCHNNNIRLLQVFENEWLYKKEIVKSIISNHFALSRRIFARKCKIIELSVDQYKKFNDNNHLQSYRSCRFRYGLIFDGFLVAAMGVSSHNKHQYEISRFVNLLNTTVVGGFQRLFNHFRKTNNPTSVLTFSDRRYFSGSVYESSGFERLLPTNPNYYYVKSQLLYSRQQFQKHKLNKKLEFFDETLTEAQNMFINRYRRIWDAGHHKLIWNKNSNG